VGTSIGDLTIQSMDHLGEYINRNNIDIAVLSIPKVAAKNVSEILIENGIKAIWNFAHLDIEAPEGVVVENVHLSDSLMKLSYRVNYLENQKNN
jgi:redox-sensing transcriptional repressor